MRNSKFCIILLNIAIILTGISFSQNNGTGNAIRSHQNLNAGDTLISGTSGNTGLQNIRLGTSASEPLKTDKFLRENRLSLEVQRRKLINMKAKLDEIYKTLSQRMDTFCSIPDKQYSDYKLDEMESKSHEVYDLTTENMIEYNWLLTINKRVKRYIERYFNNTNIYNDKVLPIIQKNAALQYHIKRMIEICLNLIKFIHDKKGVNDNIEGFLKAHLTVSPDTNSEITLYSVETENGTGTEPTSATVPASATVPEPVSEPESAGTSSRHGNRTFNASEVPNENTGFFSSTTAKVTLGILGCLLVGGGIAFAFYYKNIMYKN